MTASTDGFTLVKYIIIIIIILIIIIVVIIIIKSFLT